MSVVAVYYMCCVCILLHTQFISFIKYYYDTTVRDFYLNILIT